VTYIRHGCVFGLFSEDSLKGFTIFIKSWEDPQCAYLAEMAIERKSQGKGCGSYLLLKSLLYLKKNEINNIVLTVDPENLQALHVYRDKLGFKCEEYRENEYGQGRDRLFLKLNLENLNQWKSADYSVKSQTTINSEVENSILQEPNHLQYQKLDFEFTVNSRDC
jgi:[ribosomal protein S18]-alanine N-acetyltransferase